MTKQEYINIYGIIPELPGIYKYFDNNDKLIYVGKAKSLKKRVSSYFSSSIKSKKTLDLVSKISRIEFTIVDSEEDALLLENTLIKSHQPHYNINLKDDKTYPYIVIKNERFPRVFISRKKINDGSRYFGPFATGGKAYDIMEFIREHIPLRNCTFNLSNQNINNQKFKLCLEYHLGNCKGPCEGVQTEEDYSAGINRIVDLLKGNLTPMIIHYKKLIQQHVEKLEFEMADKFQQKIKSLQNFQKRSAVVNTKTGNTDVFTILEMGDKAYVNYLSVTNGNITATTTSTLEKKLDETKKELLEFAIAHLRNTFESKAKEIIVPFAVHFPESDIKITIPKTGDKKKLLDLSQKNVNHYKYELISSKKLQTGEKTEEEKKQILQQMQKDLRLKDIPTHIECFDNSNLHGTNAVAAMVCFKNGEPSKKDYRHFNIKTVEGINDFASMKEVVYRRYLKFINENLPLPQLIIIDGGKGQLNAALESMTALNLVGKVTLIGLAKNQEELFYANDEQPLKLSWNCETLKLIRRIRDEVHRFGIRHHRDKRSKAMFKNELEQIDGVGEKTIAKLLTQFKSLARIKNLTIEEIAKITGKSKATTIYNGIHKK